MTAGTTPARAPRDQFFFSPNAPPAMMRAQTATPTETLAKLYSASNILGQSFKPLASTPVIMANPAWPQKKPMYLRDQTSRSFAMAFAALDCWRLEGYSKAKTDGQDFHAVAVREVPADDGYRQVLRQRREAELAHQHEHEAQTRGRDAQHPERRRANHVVRVLVARAPRPGLAVRDLRGEPTVSRCFFFLLCDLPRPVSSPLDLVGRSSSAPFGRPRNGPRRAPAAASRAAPRRPRARIVQ
mmetsp:Transcript_32848/g.98913  ORF Transcript_32848/g.98913 Transcript_32848/m.98913 type:complete len:242 (-) Transcript_32848:471-1196(-)